VQEKPWMKTTADFEGLPTAWAHILVPSAEGMSLPLTDTVITRGLKRDGRKDNVKVATAEKSEQTEV
jgi:hypothetical protein